MPDTTHSLGERTTAQPVELYSGAEFANSPNAIPVPGYELIEEIGRGGMGIVWRATDLALKREVAIKILHDEYNVDSNIAERFVEEAQITSQLQHPGIPAIYGVGLREDRRPYLAMKLIKGRTLDGLIKDKSPLNHLAVFEAIAQAVGYAHAHGVIHRDLKPSNVMVGAFGEVQVMDWGLAKLLGVAIEPITSIEKTAPPTVVHSGRDSGSDQTPAGSLLGTPAYMAPEQAKGLIHKVDARSDVFGLGGILCTMLTGAPPYVSNQQEITREMAIDAKLDNAFERLINCNTTPAVLELCKHCLSKDPEARPANGEAVATMVAKLRQDAEERVRTLELENARSEARSRTRRKALAGLAAVLMLGVLGTSIGWRTTQLARDEERIAKIKANKHHQDAERNLDQLQDLTKELMFATEKVMPFIPQASDRRRALTDKGVQAFETIASQRPDDAPMSIGLGTYLLFQGNIRRLNSDYGKAEESYNKAALRLKTGEASIALKRDHALALAMQGKLKESKALFLEAIDNAKAELAMKTASIALSRQLAWSHAGLAQVEYRGRAFDACLAEIVKAREALAIVLAAKEERDVYDPLLVLTIDRWEIAALRNIGKFDAAKRIIASGRLLIGEILKVTDQRIPADDRNTFQVAFELEAIPTDWKITGDVKRVFEDYKKVCDLAGNVNARNKNVPLLRSLLAEAYVMGCTVEPLLNDADRAKKDIAESCRILEEACRVRPNDPYFLAEYGQATVCRGRLLNDPKLIETGVERLATACKMCPQDKWFPVWLSAAKSPAP